MPYYYGITSGNTLPARIFDNWHDCKAYAQRKDGIRKLKKFKTPAEAADFIQPLAIIGSTKPLHVKPRPKKYYGVRNNGRLEANIFTNWEALLKYIEGKEPATYRKFNSYQEAANFIKPTKVVPSRPIKKSVNVKNKSSNHVAPSPANKADAGKKIDEVGNQTKSMNVEPTCPVCLETKSNLTAGSVGIMSSTCGHMACDPCVSHLVSGTERKGTVKCPTCRKKLSSTKGFIKLFF